MKIKKYSYFLLIIAFFTFSSLRVQAFDVSKIRQDYTDYGGHCPSHNGDKFYGLGRGDYYSILASHVSNSSLGVTGPPENRLMYSINQLKVENNKLKIDGWAYINGMMNIATDGDTSYCYEVVDVKGKNNTQCAITGAHNNDSSYKIFPSDSKADKCVRARWGSFGERNITYKFRLLKNDNSAVEFNDVVYTNTPNDLFYFQARKSGTRGFGGLPNGDGAVMWFSGPAQTNGLGPLANHYRGKFTATLNNLSDVLSSGKYKLQMQIYAYNVPGLDSNTQYIFYKKSSNDNEVMGSWYDVSQSNLDSTWIDIGIYNGADAKIKFYDDNVIKKIENDGIEQNSGKIVTGNWQGVSHYYWKFSGSNINKTGETIDNNKEFSYANGKLVRFWSADELSGYTISQARGALVDMYQVRYGSSDKYLIPASWVKFDSQTRFIVGGSSKGAKPDALTCEERYGSDYEQVYEKEYYPIRTFYGSLINGEGLRWKKLCEDNLSSYNVDESVFYSGNLENDIISNIPDSQNYDLTDIKVTRGETTIATNAEEFDALRGKTSTFVYGGGYPVSTSSLHKFNTMALGFNIFSASDYKDPTKAIIPELSTNGVNYELKITFIPTLKSDSTYLDNHSICKVTTNGHFSWNPPKTINTNGAHGYTRDIYFPFATKVRFCAKKKEVPVCVNTTNNMKCGDGTTVTENKKGEAAYHESNDYNMCILKAQKDSGFKIVKANGKSTSDDTDMIEEDTIAKTNKNSRYCVVACRDEVDFELPNLKEAFIGSKFELNLSRNGEEATTGPTIKYKRYCVTSRIKEQAFKQDIEAQSLKVQQLYEEYRDLKYIYENLKITSLTTRTGSECDEACSCEEGDCGCCDNCTYCEYDWTLGYDGKIPNGDGKKLLDTGEASLSTITNYSKSDFAHEHHDGSCTEHPDEKDLYKIKDDPTNPNSYFNKMNDKWDEYIKAKEEQDSMAKEISNCYTWMKDDKLYTSTPAEPGINYNYDDEASQYVRGEMIPKKVTIPGVVEEQFCYKNIYNDSYCNNGYHYSTTSNYYADCHNEENASEDRCYRAYGSNPSHTPLYNNYFKIASSINLPNAYEYVKRIETKKWKYEIDPLTRTVYTNKKGEYTKGADKNSLDDYPAGYNTKITGYNVSPIAMKTIAKDGYNYTLKYSKLDDKTRKKYTSDVGDNELTLENKTTKYNVYNTNNSTYTCKYNIKADGSTTPPGTPVVTPPGSPGTTPSGNHINFFYRTINVENINPTSRMLGYNWSAGASSSEVRSDLKDIIAETGDYQKLIGNAAKSGTGVADSRSDSITFRLTPALMEDIRKNYNGTHNYSDYTGMKCSDTKSKTKFYCKSEFLECLTGQKLDGICNELDGTLLTDVADGTNLSNFRNIVKAKNEKYIN